MKVQLYGSRLSLYKSNQLWREARARHNKRDSQVHDMMNRAIFNSTYSLSYGRNSMIIKQAALRVLKSI
ncbi:hypothetical protein [Maritalea mediterranea]|uniref:Uncharacterized protein n=1 Tax=Maritalea mediterranea TaxID=2909667 RepID=A0ABS9ECD3_9HYPH|nr:hypothetical protein [Maritalea mediterranea]MCF4099078.1 hypothetical protein [Maritalea mediterranea]